MKKNLEALIFKENKILTGFRDIDTKLKELRRGHLITIVSRPENVKTILAVNIATLVAKEGISVAIFNLKDDIEQVIDKIIASETFIDREKSTARTLIKEEKNNVFEKTKQIKKKIHIYNNLDLEKLKEKNINLLLNNNLELVIIDDIESIKRNKEEVWLELNKMSKELNIPILVTSKIDMKEQEYNRPYLSDLSSQLLKNSNEILIVYSKDSYIECNIRGEILKVEIAKNSSGDCGIVELINLNKSFEIKDI